jgi:hypothetical protein
MPFLPKLLHFWRNLWRGKQLERDLNDELETYIDELAERKASTGLSDESAREAALAELGGIDRIKNLVRQQRMGFGMAGNLAMVITVAAAAFISGTLVESRPRQNPAQLTRTPAQIKALPVRSQIKLSGRLLDNATGQPIPNVEVALEPHPALRHFTFTESDGSFSFRDPPSTGYILVAGEKRLNFLGTGAGKNCMWPNDEFILTNADTVKVLNKNGEPQPGEPLLGWVDFSKQKGIFLNFSKVRTFSYSGNTVELRVRNLVPGVASLTQ